MKMRRFVLTNAVSLLIVACSGADDAHDEARGGESVETARHALDRPDDLEFPAQWNLENTGQAVPWFFPDASTSLVPGVTGVDVNMLRAWEITQGSSAVIVGVAEENDVDVTHEDLRDNVFVNGREIAGDGRDNDGNGCIDDVRGCDFMNGDGMNLPSFHATHVSGIVAGRINNRKGVAGVAPKVKLLPLTSRAEDETFIAAIAYARRMGVRVINCSQGGLDWFNPDVREAIRTSNILFVCSAGNRGTPRFNFPSSYDLPNVLAVANVNNLGELSERSSYGEPHVDIAAPGRSILSTVPGNGYDYESGTSMAAPHVAGVAALLMNKFPNLTVAEVVARLERTAMRLSSLTGMVKTGGMVDARAALTDVSAIRLNARSEPGRVVLSWNAQAGASRYEVERDGVIVNNGAGTTHTHSGLAVDSGHVYRVRAIVSGNAGAWSHRFLKKASRDPVEVSRRVDSPHPYPDDFFESYAVTQPNAVRIRVHFSRLDTAPGDTLEYVRSFPEGDDTLEPERLDGNYPAGFWTHWVDGDTFLFEFMSDGSGNGFGFSVDRIQYVPRP